MIVLGINDGHNASAALARDGVIVAAVQEERLTRNKSQAGFPALSVAEVLRLAGLTLDDVDRIAAANVFQPTETAWAAEDILARWGGRGRGPLRRALKSFPPIFAARKRQLFRRRRSALAAAGMPPDRTRFVEHHKCHAAAAYFAGRQTEEPALVLTADGLGDYVCATVNIGEAGGVKRLAHVPDEHSLGNLYQMVTYLLGMVPTEHEYKVMGLAPYGLSNTKHAKQVRDGFAGLFEFVGDGTRWQCTGRVQMGPEYLHLVERIVAKQRFDWVAAGIQWFLEDFLMEWVTNCIEAHGIDRLHLGGGVFMNVKANQKILAMPQVAHLFAMPSAGDESNSIGAAYVVSGQDGHGGDPPRLQPLDHLYLGATIAAKDADALPSERAGTPAFHARRMKDPAAEVAALLAAGKIVARATGPMEFGARALGNRSILADPSHPAVVQVINAQIKNRDFWMPFAPLVRTDAFERSFERMKGVRFPYMTITTPVRSEAWPSVQAAAHPSDRTARPQELPDAWNAELAALLEAFEALTGRSVLLNTSFNLHGEPIVCRADEALDVFLRSGLEHVQIGDMLFSKVDARPT